VNLATFVAPASVVANATGTNYTITGSGAIGGSGGITKSGASIFTVDTNASYTGPTTVLGGRLVLKGAKARGPALSSSAGSDINGGRLVLDYTGETDPSATVLNLLQIGNGEGTKFSTGALRIGTAASAANSKGLGYFDDAVASQYSLVMTYFGDANLDGKVNALDFNAVATNFGTGTTWAQGDFNYDGSVTTNDFTMLAQNFNQSLSNSPPAGPLALGAVVPEPISIGWLAFACLGSRRARRRPRAGQGWN
jgi:fibronectin-binding autotransporter adhesin